MLFEYASTQEHGGLGPIEPANLRCIQIAHADHLAGGGGPGDKERTGNENGGETAHHSALRLVRLERVVHGATTMAPVMLAAWGRQKNG